MADTTAKLNIIREAGDIATQLLHLGYPTPSPDCPTDEDGNPLLKEDDQFWSHMEQIETILRRFGDVERDYNPSKGVVLEVDRMVDGELFCKFFVLPGLKDTGAMTVQFVLNNDWHTAIDHWYPDLKQVDIGRYIAKAELSILAGELGSNAETLDYWMAECVDYHDEQWDQSKWAKARNVSRQSVSQNVRDAKQKIG